VLLGRMVEDVCYYGEWLRMGVIRENGYWLRMRDIRENG